MAEDEKKDKIKRDDKFMDLYTELVDKVNDLNLVSCPNSPAPNDLDITKMLTGHSLSRTIMSGELQLHLYAES